MLAPEKLTVSEPAAATTVSKLPIAVIKALRPHRHRRSNRPRRKTLIVSLPVPPMIVSPEPVSRDHLVTDAQLDVAKFPKTPIVSPAPPNTFAYGPKDTDLVVGAIGVIDRDEGAKSGIVSSVPPEMKSSIARSVITCGRRRSRRARARDQVIVSLSPALIKSFTPKSLIVSPSPAAMSLKRP